MKGNTVLRPGSIDQALSDPVSPPEVRTPPPTAEPEPTPEDEACNEDGAAATRQGQELHQARARCSNADLAGP